MLCIGSNLFEEPAVVSDSEIIIIASVKEYAFVGTRI